MENVNCLKCRHFFTTWDPAKPRGCHKFGFKSLSFPSQEVRRETGQECNHFSKKAEKNQERDLSDPKYW